MKTSIHWAQMEERGVIWGMKFLLRTYLLFGRTVLQIFLYPVVIYYWLTNRTARHASQAYLNRLADFAPSIKLDGSLLWSYRHFVSFANALIDKLAAWSGTISQSDVAYKGRDELLGEISKGRGVLLLGAHLGNLEVCRIIADFDNAPPINVLVHTKHAQKFNALMAQSNTKSQLNLIQVTEITAATAQLLSDKIEAGELIIMTADRTPVSNQQRVSKVAFLGKEALFPQGPFILAGLLKCSVYTLFCLKQQHKFVIYIEPFSESITVPRKTREREMQQIIQRYAERLQAYCLKEPLQWFNFFDFWQEPVNNEK
jgi:predicted LPLAT superfamily acyltransferase